ncbi:MAG: porin, partial [Gammaproteobacteria bacterium]|nr:porin [Gammaproteobacteria bacterium]
GLSWDFALHSGLAMPTGGSSAFRVRSGRQKVSNAAADDLAYTLRGRYTGVSGLQLAATVQFQTDASQMSGDGLDEGVLLSLHGTFERGPFGLRALYARWDFDGDTVEAAGADEQSGWFIEPSYRFKVRRGEFGLYTRFEDVEGARSQDQFEQWELGFNYWPVDNVVFKFDYRNREHDLAAAEDRDFNGFDLGMGYQF